MTTEKTIALTGRTFAAKVRSLFFNVLSRLVIAFLPRSKCLNFMAAVTICSDFRKPQNSLSLFPLFSHLFAMKWWNSNTLATWCEELTHWKRLWCWEGAGERDDRGWDRWMASLTRWTWVWETPGVGDGQGGLACCDSWGRKELDTTEWLNWTELMELDAMIFVFWMLSFKPAFSFTLLFHFNQVL